MQNIVINIKLCEKFPNDRLRNDRSLGNRNSDNNKKNNVGGHWGPVPRSKNSVNTSRTSAIMPIVNHVDAKSH